MAKDRHHPNQTSHMPTGNRNDNSGKFRQANSQAEKAPQLSNRVRIEVSEEPVDNLKRLMESDDPKYPVAVIDRSNRIWIFGDALSEPIECFGYSRRLASSFRRDILKTGKHRSSDQDALEEPSNSWDGLDLDVCREPGTPRAGRHSKNWARKKRLPASVDASPAKRRRSSHLAQDDGKSDSAEDDGNDEEDDDFVGVTFETQGVRVCKLKGIQEDILRKLQQKGLKQMQKAWLRKCHPQKQATHPYNGGKDQEQKRLNGDPDYDDKNPGLLTAPDYWPSQEDWKSYHGHIGTGVRHKEPDHIYKHERITLAMHLLHAGSRYNDAKFDLDKLKESTLNITNDYPKDFHPDADMLIASLHHARSKEIEYENGEIDADTIVYVLMPATPPPKPKRMARPRKPVTKAKQDTPETGGFFELGTPIHPSPPNNSSFTSVFNNTVKSEYGHTSPFPNAVPAHPDATFPSTHAAMERIASQASSGHSYLSTSASEGLGGHRSNKNTPAPSEGDMEVDLLDEMADVNQHLELGSSQSLTPRPESEHNAKMHGLNAALSTPVMPLSASLAPAVSTFHHDLPSHLNGHHCHMSTAEQQTTVGPDYINPGHAQMHQPSINNTALYARRSYADSITTTYAPTTHAPATYILHPPQQQQHQHPHQHQQHHQHQTSNPPPMAPPPNTINTTARLLGPTSEPGYPSTANADFNSAMPTDPNWHFVDLAYQWFRDGTYPQPQRALPVSVGNPEGQQGVGVDRGGWASEYDALAHDPRRLAVQGPGNMGQAIVERKGTGEGAGEGGRQQRQQQQQQQGRQGSGYGF